MPRYEITSPDGSVYEVDAPEGATEQDAIFYVQSNMQAQPQIEQAPKNNRGIISDYISKASLSNVPQNLGNIAAGAIRGAGSIGATVLAPYDMAKDAIAGKGLSLDSNMQRRQAMDAGLEQMGADTESLGYAGGKLAGEIAGTAGIPIGVGSQVAKVAPKLGSSIASGGFTLGTPAATTAIGKAADLGVRTAGGAISGGLVAGAVDPQEAKTGAIVGAIVPSAVKSASALGEKIGARASKKVAEKLATKGQSFKVAKEANKLGYVIPPADLDPSITSELASGISGKIKTAQVASQRNQEITNNLAKKALGLADDDVLDFSTLDALRKKAGEAYGVVSEVGKITPSASYEQALNNAVKPFKSASKSFPNRAISPIVKEIDALKTQSFDAGDAVETIKLLRDEAGKAYRAGDKIVGKAYKQSAEALENAIEEHLVKSSASKGVLNNYREARKAIAKTYTIENALNPNTGNIDAIKIGKEVLKRKPLDSELLQIGKFANAFPKAAQALKETPKQISPLDYAMAGTGAVATGNVLPLAMIGARPALRGALLSKNVQKRAIKDLLKETGSNGNLLTKVANNKLIEKAAKTAPVISAQ